MSLILMTTVFYKALILQGEIWCWSLLRLKGLNRDFNDLNSNSVKYIYFSNNLNNFLKTRKKKIGVFIDIYFRCNYWCICCGSILSLVYILFSFVSNSLSYITIPSNIQTRKRAAEIWGLWGCGAASALTNCTPLVSKMTDIVGCYVLRPFAHPVACCCVLLVVGAQSLNPSNVLRAKGRNNSLRPSVQDFKELWGMYNPGQKVLGYNPFLTCFWMEFAANGQYLLINAAGGGGQLEMHFLLVKHSVPNILTRIVVKCYIPLIMLSVPQWRNRCSTNSLALAWFKASVHPL